MSTTTPGADQLQALINYSNNKTGASDTTLSDAVTRLVEGYSSSGGYSGIEIKVNSNGQVTDYIFHGMETIPQYVLNYTLYSVNPAIYNPPIISFADSPKTIEKGAFRNCKCFINWSSLSELEKVGEDYVFALNYSVNADASSQIVNLPKYRGYVNNTYSGINLFRPASNNAPYGPLVFNLPLCEIIPQYAWYNYSGSGINITIGSIGHNVIGSLAAPFGATPNANGTITIYTNGSYLDGIKTEVMKNNPGSGLTFVYKAAEATTYNGTSYNAGDTIIV